MWLSNVDLHRYLKTGQIKIDPPPTLKDVQPASIDVHLGGSGKMYKMSGDTIYKYIDPGIDQDFLFGNVIIPPRSSPSVFTLEPGQSMLAYIQEHVWVPRFITVLLHGCSGLARYQLFIHVNAGLLDPNWNGKATLEMYNAAPLPIRLWEGMRIGTLTFHRMQTPSDPGYGEGIYNSSYQGDESVQASKYHRNWDSK